MQHHHFEDGVGGVEPAGHDHLQEVLALQVLLVLLELDLEGLEHLVHLVGLAVHDRAGQLNIRSMMKAQKALLRGLSSSPVPVFFHFLPAFRKDFKYNFIGPILLLSLDV